MQFRIRQNFVNLGNLHSLKPWPPVDLKQLCIHQNFVNLGKLYSLKPWSIAQSKIESACKNFVNLGSLYTLPWPQKEPTSWAYFEDGSVFLHSSGWLAHDELQRRMKIAAHFVHKPSPKMQAVREKDPGSQRLILVTKVTGHSNKPIEYTKHKPFCLLARSSREEEHAMVLDRHWEHISMHLDSAATHPVYSSSHIYKGWQERHIRLIKNALCTFRGTLIDGTLQPNVRLGNGLPIENKAVRWEPWIQQQTETQKAKTESRSKDSSVPKNPATKAQPNPLIRTYVSPARGRPPPPKLISGFFADEQQSKLERAKIRKQQQETQGSQQQLLLQSTQEQHNPVHRLTSNPNSRNHNPKYGFFKQDMDSASTPSPNTQNLHYEANSQLNSERKTNFPGNTSATHHANTSPVNPHPSPIPPNPNATPSSSLPETASSDPPPSITSTPAPSALAALRSRTDRS